MISSSILSPSNTVPAHVEPPYSELIAAIGRELSLPSLAPDSDNRCHLSIDDRLDLNVLYRPDDGMVWLASPIGSLRLDDVDAYRRMLEANAFGRGTGGAELAIEGGLECSQAMMLQAKSLAALDAAALLKWIEQFIGMAERWRSWIDRRITAEPKEGPPGVPNILDSSFIRA
jgi:hypothetical protein